LKIRAYALDIKLKNLWTTRWPKRVYGCMREASIGLSRAHMRDVDMEKNVVYYDFNEMVDGVIHSSP